MEHQTERIAHQGRFKIQSLLVGLLAFTLIGSTAILTVVSIQHQNETIMRTTRQKNFEAARNLAIAANTIKQLMFKQLGGTGRYIIDEELPLDGEGRTLGALLMGNGIFNGSLLVDGEGEVLVSTLGTGFAVGDRLGVETGISLTGHEIGPWMSAPFVSPGGHRVVLALHPMKAGDERTAVYIAGLVDLEIANVFSDMFSHTIKSDPGTYAYLVDRSGELMMSAQADRAGEVIPAKALLETFGGGDTESDGASEGLVASPGKTHERTKGPGQDGRGQGDGPLDRSAPMSPFDEPPGRPGEPPGQGSGSVPRSAMLADGNGVETLVGYLRVGDLGWGVVVQSPIFIVDKAKREFISTQLKWSVPLIAAFLLLSLWMARKMAAPFARLTAVARSIASGERAGRPPFESHWNYEAHHLARAMMTAVQGLQHQADEMSLQARTDRLTRLANRTGLDEWLKAREGDSAGYALMVIDIDHFKSVNDKYGHQIGDDTLVHLASILKAECRETDLVCRIGGEEFVAVLPGEKLEGATLLAERVRGRVEDAISPTGRPITVSIGIGACSEPGESFDTTFQLADGALYEAKRAGRNRTMASA
ncbi:sensor domain-containing diguanylate cyclase [Cohnella soli]|uniref:Diguanylate cyclase n=1 Tax=Cohnella soli TaxID=425005 RepID=A0ABW0HMC8_9BACL